MSAPLVNQAALQQAAEQRIHTGHESAPFLLALVHLRDLSRIRRLHGEETARATREAVIANLQRVLRPADCIAPTQDDEQLVLFATLRSAHEGTLRLRELYEAASQPLNIPVQEQGSPPVRACALTIAAARFPQDAGDFAALEQCAQQTLPLLRAESKAFGFPEKIDRPSASEEQERERFDFEQRLRDAITQRTPIRAYYQPKVRIRSNEATVHGFEALVRWQDGGQLVSPGKFITVAKELGLLDALAEIMLENIARDIPGLRDVYGDDIRVSYNLSAAQVTDHDFIRRQTRTIRQHDLARNLIIEITEDQYLPPESLPPSFQPGVESDHLRIAMDDFGTGFSSLAMLARINIDEIKIDRALVQDIHLKKNHQHILDAIDAIVTRLEIPHAVVEGVEKTEELDYLLKHVPRLDIIQGFLFGRPEPVWHWLQHPLDAQVILAKQTDKSSSR